MTELTNQAKGTIALLQQAINGIHQLRSTVTNVFDLLCDGVQPDDDCSTKIDEAEGNVFREGKKFLAKFQEHLQSVNKDYNEVEKFCNSMSSVSHLSQLGPSTSLGLDSLSDKSSIYPDAILTYQWHNRIHEYAQIAYSVMMANQIRKSQAQGQTVHTKRRRAIAPKFHSTTSQYFELALKHLARQVNELSIKFIPTMSTGDTRVLQINVGRVFVAVVVLRSFLIEKISIVGNDEIIKDEKGKVDLFTRSEYQCFQIINDHAMSAVLHYHTFHTTPVELPLKYILFWLHSYRGLFSEPCSICGKFLDRGFPPLWRDYRNPVPCHDSCKL